MKLHVRNLGGRGSPLVILHGLYGSSRNWQAAGKRLAKSFSVMALDLRNHGQSAHDANCSYAAMAQDVRETLSDLALERPVLIGHSLGGKVAMRFACSYPKALAQLVIVDIAPREVRPTPDYLVAMQRADLDQARRSDVEEQLRAVAPESSLRAFLMTNLGRSEASGETRFRWRLNVDGLLAGLGEVGAAPIGAGDRYEGRVHVLAGEQSDYVRDEDLVLFREFFPAVRRIVVKRAGHDVHVDQTEVFCDIVRQIVVHREST